MVTIMSVDGKSITSVNEWFAYAPPARGELQWKDGRSAKELAKAWFRSGDALIPAELSAILHSHPVTRSIQMEAGIPEKITILDEFKGSGRNHDMIVTGKTPDQRIVIGIEAKTDEPFGEQVGKYLLASIKANPRSRVPDRIRQLSHGLFGHMECADLRYQLLHAVAGTLIEAVEKKASVAVLVIHEFVPATGKTEKAKRNDQDLSDFIKRLSGRQQPLPVGELIGPIQVPGGGRIPSNVPLYIGKIESMVEKR